MPTTLPITPDCRNCVTNGIGRSLSARPFSNSSVNIASEPGSATGSGRQKTASSAVKMALVAPMPSASESTAVITNPGLRRNVRRA